MTPATRVAKNESFFREVNERINELSERFHTREESPVEFVCECSRLGCVEQVSLTLSEYQEVRAVPTHFAVAPGHVEPDHERVVRSNPRFTIVEKEGVAGAEAAAST